MTTQKAFSSSEAFELQFPCSMLTQETWTNTNPCLWEKADTTGKATAQMQAMDLTAKASQQRETNKITEFISQVKIYFCRPGGQSGLLLFLL